MCCIVLNCFYICVVKGNKGMLKGLTNGPELFIKQSAFF
jgi:hypothetical protein